MATSSALVISACGADDGGTSPVASSSAVVSTSATETNVYLAQRAQGVAALLDSLSQVLTSGTRAQLDALLDASAAPELRTRLQTVQDNLSPARAGAAETQALRGRGTQLELDSLRYQLAPTEEAETLLPAELAARLAEQGSSDTWVAPVEIHFALGGATRPGIAEDDVVIVTQLVAARYDDTWRLVGDATAVGEPAPPTQMWDLAGLGAADVTTAGGTSVIASYPGTEAVVDRVRKLLPGAVQAVDAVWSKAAWPQRGVVVATATDAQFTALAGSSAESIAAAAATVYATLDPARKLATGQRIILTPAAAELPAPALGVVLRHELTHVATRAYTAATAPMWLTEGFAEYVGRKDTYTRPADAAPELAALVAAGATPDQLPADSLFALGGEATTQAYQSAWSVSAFIADRFGEQKLTTLYRAVAAAGEQAQRDAAINQTLGITHAQLVTQWRQWLNKEMR